MKKISGIFLIFFLFAGTASVRAQILKNVWNEVKRNSNNTPQNSSNNSLNSLSNSEITTALREALELGAKNASQKLSAQNGFFGNAAIKILLPPEAQKVETALRQFGMGRLVDETVLSMNRAAEDAALKAAPIFINAIKSMSIQDGIQVIRGGQGAATNFLKSRTTAELTNAFRPVIQTSLNKWKVDNYWNQVFTFYNKLPTSYNKINPDLTAYVTERALDGLFKTIAEEENKIRVNPEARVTDLLKKVFGAR